MKLNYTPYQWNILTIYFIIGLPMLPMVPWMLFCQWITSNKNPLKREGLEDTIIFTLSLQVAMTLFLGLIALALYFLH